MDKAIVLAVAASVCTAMSSVCQRRGAKGTQVRGFDVGLVVRLGPVPPEGAQPHEHRVRHLLAVGEERLVGRRRGDAGLGKPLAVAGDQIGLP